MAVPRNRMSNARKNSRRSHMAKKPKGTTACTNCKKPILTHALCHFCGYYKNRSVLNESQAT
ncbi:MAG: 50S ribosomal protein L32 [Chlamydiota bacterium]